MHQYRVELPNKRAVDFGVKGRANYTTHGNPYMAREHLIECGGVVAEEIRAERDAAELHRALLWVDSSTLEDWEDIHTSAYWDRWLLWTYPTLHQAKLFMTMRKGILFMPMEEGMWYL